MNININEFLKELDDLPETMSQSGLKKSSAVLGKKVHSDEFKATLRQRATGRVDTEQARENRRASKLGVKKSEAHKAAISAGLKGIKKAPHTEEGKANISKALRGKPKSPEWSAKIKAINLAKRIAREEAKLEALKK